MEAIEALCGDIVSKEKITGESNSNLRLNIILLHFSTAMNDISCNVESVKVTSLNDQLYEYTAFVQTSQQDELQTVKGTVQFNDENLIDYFTHDSVIKMDPLP